MPNIVASSRLILTGIGLGEGVLSLIGYSIDGIRGAITLPLVGATTAILLTGVPIFRGTTFLGEPVLYHYGQHGKDNLYHYGARVVGGNLKAFYNLGRAALGKPIRE